MKIRVKETGETTDLFGEFLYLMYMANIMDWIITHDYVGWEAPEQTIAHWRAFLAESDREYNKLVEVIDKHLSLKEKEAWEYVRELGAFNDPINIPQNCRLALKQLKRKYKIGD